MSQATLQVLGDSYAVRFCNFFRSNPELAESLRPSLVRGISGARISDIKVFVKLNISDLQRELPLLILLGTNDFLADVDLAAFKNKFLSLLRLLRRNYPGMAIVFTTLPLYPRVSKSTSAIARLHQINNFLLTLRSDLVKVIDLPQEINQAQYFHAYYGNSGRRDGIHFNNAAFLKLIPLIEKSVLPSPSNSSSYSQQST